MIIYIFRMPRNPPDSPFFFRNFSIPLTSFFVSYNILYNMLRRSFDSLFNTAGMEMLNLTNISLK
jgi:hypothetical protein